MPDFNSSEFAEINPAAEPPQISILMPLFNQQEFVAEAVSSVLAQEGVVAEIILSDDCSEDNTAGIAERCVRNAARAGLPHRVLFRRGASRLWRDHLVLLSERASCDVVCQAHGDDVSLPHRAATIMRVARDVPGAAMFVSRFHVIGSDPVDDAAAAGVQASFVRVPENVVIKGHPSMFGFCQAWRKSRLGVFGRLDTQASVTAHDRIMAYRSFLAGGVLRIEETLVHRRMHQEAASLRLYAGEARRLSVQLSALARCGLMAHDTERALAVNLIDHKKRDALLAQVREYEARVIATMTEEYKILTRRGWRPVWQEADP